MKKSTRYEMRDTRYENGSALILAVVLTSLLAVLGVMFVMIARVDRIATSAISENKDLNSAVEAVIAKISQELVLDVPGMSKGREYYDYPDGENAWLASLEPYDSGGYKWRQISDVTGFLADNNYDTDDVDVDPPGLRKYIQEYPEITLDTSGELDELLADADGDGIADSKWVELDDITSNKGKAIYAAVRVVDNGAMLNVNTAYKFDPNGTPSRDRIDGSSQTQIDLLTLAERGSTPNPLGRLDNERYGSEPQILDNYIEDVVWRYNEPNGAYTPFDISDELELRYRFTLNRTDVDSRIEEVWDHAFQGPNPSVPIGTGSLTLNDWFDRTQLDLSEPNAYSYRHIGTIYNMDRIIRPDGGKMLNINDPCVSVGSVCETIKTALGSTDPNFGDVNDVAAQIAVNIKDFSDANAEVTTHTVGGTTYYGFEAQPFISEIGIQIGADPCIEAGNHFAIELYNPFDVNIPLDDFDIELEPSGTLITFGPGDMINANGRYVIVNHGGSFAPAPEDKVDAGLVLADNYTGVPGNYTCIKYNILLTRQVIGPQTIYLDRQDTQPTWFTQAGTDRYVQRDDDNWQIVYENEYNANTGNTLGSDNGHSASRPNYNLALANSDFITIGDISKVLRVGPSTDPCDTIGEQLASATSEADVRIDLADDSDYHNLFQYLTVFDPTADGINNDGDRISASGPEIIDEFAIDWTTPEFKIAGRININTAPWYVIAQLPWMTETIAQAIVNDRDTQDGFESIGELMLVDGMHYYTLGPENGIDLEGFPDLTPGGSTGDGAIDDFEERDVIFARISNLVAVRSDVFTAYILVRIGADGPQKRVIAILDRSDVYPPDGGKVRIVALHPVADPR